MKFYTYVLYSETHDRIYIGHTDDLERRLKQHNSGKVDSTKPYRPLRLIYFEEFERRSDAIMREKRLKLSTGRRYVRRFITNNLVIQ